MINTNLFLCDVYGTISCDDSSSLKRKSNIKKFVDNLEKLRKINSSEILIFSLFTTARFEDAEDYYYELLNKFNNQNVIMGPIFTEDRILPNIQEIVSNKIYSKLEYQLAFIEYLKKFNKYNIQRIYYAEDCNINTQIFLNLINRLYSDIECIIINPKGLSDDNINETNIEIKKYIKKVI